MIMKDAFTLLELLVVIAIISILTSIAYPNYSASIKKTYRNTAEMTLMSLTNELESYYGNHNSYNNAESSNLFKKSDKHYRYHVRASDEHYVITATPIKGDKTCGVLGITDHGVRSSSGSAALSSCW